MTTKTISNCQISPGPWYAKEARFLRKTAEILEGPEPDWLKAEKAQWRIADILKVINYHCRRDNERLIRRWLGF